MIKCLKVVEVGGWDVYLILNTMLYYDGSFFQGESDRERIWKSKTGIRIMSAGESGI